MWLVRARRVNVSRAFSAFSAMPRNSYLSTSSDEGGPSSRRRRSPSPSPRGRSSGRSRRRSSPSLSPRPRGYSSPSSSPEPRRGRGRGNRRRQDDSNSDSGSESENGAGHWRDERRSGRWGKKSSSRSSRDGGSVKRSKSVERVLRNSLADTARDGNTIAEALVHSLQDADRTAHGRVLGRLGVRAVLECLEEHGLTAVALAALPRVVGGSGGSNSGSSGGSGGGGRKWKGLSSSASKALIDALLPGSLHARDSSGRVNYVEFLRRFGVDAPRIIGVKMLALLFSSSAATAQATAQLQAADSRVNGRVTGVLRLGAALEALQAVAPGMTAEQISAALACFPAGVSRDNSGGGSGGSSSSVDYGMMLRAHARHSLGGDSACLRGSVAEWLESQAAPVERRNFDELMALLAAYEHKRGLRGAAAPQQAGDGSVTMALGPRLRVTMNFRMMD